MAVLLPECFYAFMILFLEKLLESIMLRTKNIISDLDYVGID